MHIQLTWRVTFLAIAIILAPLSYPRILYAEAIPRACNNDDPIPLGDETAPVVVGSPTFMHNGHSFHAKTYGLSYLAPDSIKPPYEMCFRYIFKNVSTTENIDNFSWPDIGWFPTGSVKPAKHIGIVYNILRNNPDVGELNSYVYSWTNSQGLTKSTFPIFPSKMDTSQFTNTSGEAFQAGVYDDRRMPFFPANDVTTLPTLSVATKDNDHNLIITANAVIYRGDGAASSSLNLSYSGKDNPDVKIDSSILLSIFRAKFTQSQDVDARTDYIISSIPTKKNEPFALGAHHKINLQYRLNNKADDPSLFLVYQTAHISAGNWETCLLIPFYSPVPISTIGDKFCK